MNRKGLSGFEILTGLEYDNLYFSVTNEGMTLQNFSFSNDQWHFHNLLHKRFCFGNCCGQSIQVFSPGSGIKCLTTAAALHFLGSFANN